jgi:hypothetical protein
MKERTTKRGGKMQESRVKKEGKMENFTCREEERYKNLGMTGDKNTEICRAERRKDTGIYSEE